jgi:hypothetical protein
VLGRLHRKGECRLEIGLVEARVAAVCVVLCELAVEVRAAVQRIAEPDNSRAIARVGPCRPDRDRVLGGESVELEAAALESCRELTAVELGDVNSRTLEFDEGGGPRLPTRERDGGRRLERLVAGGEVQANVVVVS